MAKSATAVNNSSGVPVFGELKGKEKASFTVLRK
jgi:hypothetical protein